MYYRSMFVHVKIFSAGKYLSTDDAVTACVVKVDNT